MIDSKAARTLAIEIVKGFEKELGVELTLVGDDVPFDGGWIFNWDSMDFLQTQDFSQALVGNAAIVIFKDGSVRQALSSLGEPEKILNWLKDNPDRGWIKKSQPD